MESLTELFCDVDDFCQAFMPVWNRQLLESGQKHRHRTRSLQSNDHDDPNRLSSVALP